MWIFQGLMVCCAIMGMSRMANAQGFQTKLNEYKKELKEELRIWKVDNLQRRKELVKWKKKQINEIKVEKDNQLKQIEDEFTEKIESLGMSMRKKSEKFQLKSDLALVKSIKMKREKFTLVKKTMEQYYKDLQKVELTYNEKYREYKLESFREKQELLNDNKPTFFPNFNKLTNIRNPKKLKKIKFMKNQFCKIQNFFQKQQFNLDYAYSKYENITPLEMNVKHLKNLKELASQEVQVLNESLNAINIMVEQMGKTPKELNRLKKQMHRAQKSEQYYLKKYSEDELQLTLLKNGLKAAKSKREEQLGCDSEVMITNIQAPRNMNEHSRIGELY